MYEIMDRSGTERASIGYLELTRQLEPQSLEALLKLATFFLGVADRVTLVWSGRAHKPVLRRCVILAVVCGQCFEPRQGPVRCCTSGDTLAGTDSSDAHGAPGAVNNGTARPCPACCLGGRHVATLSL